MGKSQETWNKKEKENKKKKKKEDKAKIKEERKANPGSSAFEDMLMYVDENGNLSSTPPDPLKKKKVIAENISLGVPIREEADENDGLRSGTVTFFDSSKGYGFIKCQDSQESIFTHINGHLEEIKEGNKVLFKTEKGPKGLNAIEVKQDKPKAAVKPVVETEEESKDEEE
jgi:cold shock CspA family protein